MARYPSVIQDRFGRPLTNVEVTVLTRAGALADIFADDDSPLPNPIRTDEFGAIVFNAPDAVYTLEYRDGGRLTRVDEQIVGTPPEFRGDPGPQGYSAATLAQLKAAPTTDGPLNYDSAVWEFRTDQNYSSLWDDVNYVQSDSGGTGAWVRQGADKVASKQTYAPAVLAVSTELDALGIHPLRWGWDGLLTSDATPFVQAAIEECASATNPRELLIPGKARITETLNIDRLVDTTVGQFILKGTGVGGGFLWEGDGPLFSSTLPFGVFPGAGGPQDAPPSEYVTFRDLLLERANAADDAYAISDKFLRIRFDQCEFRRLKCLESADYVQTVYFNGCHVRGWQGTFFTATDGYDVLVDGGTMFEAGAAGFDFGGGVNRFAWFGGIFEGCTGSALQISGVNGLTMHGVYFEGNQAREVVLGTGGGVSRGLSILGNKFNLPSGRASPYPVDLGRAYAVAIEGNYSNDQIAITDLVYPFQVGPGINYPVTGGTGFSSDPWTAANITATPGGTQSTAYLLSHQTNIVTTAVAGSGVRMPMLADYNGSEPITLINIGANTINLFPGLGERFLGAATNAAVTVATGDRVQMYRSSDDFWITQ